MACAKQLPSPKFLTGRYVMVRPLYRLSVQSMNKSKLLSLIVLLGKDTKSSHFIIQHFIK